MGKIVWGKLKNFRRQVGGIPETVGGRNGFWLLQQTSYFSISLQVRSEPFRFGVYDTFIYRSTCLKCVEVNFLLRKFEPNPDFSEQMSLYKSTHSDLDIHCRMMFKLIIVLLTTFKVSCALYIPFGWMQSASESSEFSTLWITRNMKSVTAYYHQVLGG